MADTIQSLYNIRLLDELARKDSVIHRRHPLAKLLTTLIYLVAVISYGKYEISALLPLVFYPVIVLALADVPAVPLLRRLVLVLPLIMGIGILNPFFDHQVVVVAGQAISRGWLTFFSIILKSMLTVFAALLLVATTGLERIAHSLRLLKVSRLFVLQLLLTYRYISVLTEEVGRILRAYFLRAPGQKGLNRHVWGPLLGQLLLRTFERAQRVYQAMCLRGFSGEYHTGPQQRINRGDLAYLFLWFLYFAAARLCDIPALLGLVLTGGIK